MSENSVTDPALTLPVAWFVEWAKAWALAQPDPERCRICNSEKRRPDGRPFEIARRPTARGICWRCRLDARNTAARNARAAKRQDRACPACPTVFTPTRSHAVYCSDRCRKRAHRQCQQGQPAKTLLGVADPNTAPEIATEEGVEDVPRALTAEASGSGENAACARDDP